MYINKFFSYLATILILSGCASSDKTSGLFNDWYDYDSQPIGAPSQMYGQLSDGYGSTDDTAPSSTIAVLLPLTGQNANVGKTIRKSVEIAVLESGKKNLNVSFYDTNRDFQHSIDSALSTNPTVIIGPVFSNNVKSLRDQRPEHIPVLSFTSDATAIGDGVTTMNLMPTNGIEAIVHQMRVDNAGKFIIFAPDTTSGQLLAGTAKNAASIYDLSLGGIFYYTPGDPESIKSAASSASMYNTRTSAHTRARQVLSDILINERLTALEKSSLNSQLNKLSKTDTIGRIPYNAILFLGDGNDTKSLASYLRYYDVAARDAKFYGTTMWDGSDIASDITMSGAKYTTLPPISPRFSNLYERVSGTQPDRLASFGYDAANMAIGMIYSGTPAASYLFNPSGYIGSDGLFRLTPSGASERALRIVALDGFGTVTEISPAPSDFIKPLYNIEQRHISPAPAMKLETPGIDPDDYINIPERLRNKYRSKTIGTNITIAPTIQKSEIVSIIPPQTDETSIRVANYTPLNLESVSRSYIDEYEIYEE